VFGLVADYIARLSEDERTAVLDATARGFYLRRA
jgi:hypothetical protein